MLKLAALAIFSLLSSSAWADIRKRDNSNTLRVPISIDDNGQHGVKVDMSTGAALQSFLLMLTTSTGYVAVAGTGCGSCGSSSLYNSTASPSAKTYRPGSQNISMVGSSTTGQVIKEDCALKEVNGSTWKYPNASVLVVNQTSSAYSKDSSGFFGLGTNRQSGDASDTVFGGVFARNSSKSKFTYGMELNAPDNSSKDGGLLHWGAPDNASYVGQIMTMNVTTNSTSEWTVPMDAWQFTSGGQTVSLPGPGLPTVVDPFYPNIFVPQSQAQLMYAKVSGATPQTPNTLSQAWTVPCDAKMSFATTFGSETFVLTESTLVVKKGDSCVGAIEAWNDVNNGEYLLGVAFISKVYLIFSISKDGADSIGFGRRGVSSSSPPSGGAIAGIVVGVLAFIAAVSLGAWFFYRSRRRNEGTTVDSSPSKEGAVDPYPMTPSSGTFIHVSSPPSSELGSPHVVPTDSLYSHLPMSPESPSQESWEDTQRRVTMSVQRNEETLGRNVAPSIDVERNVEAERNVAVERGGTPPPSFSEATSNSGGYRPPRRAKN